MIIRDQPELSVCRRVHVIRSYVTENVFMTKTNRLIDVNLSEP